MKKLLALILIIASVTLLFASCNLIKKDEPTAKIKIAYR